MRRAGEKPVITSPEEKPNWQVTLEGISARGKIFASTVKEARISEQEMIDGVREERDRYKNALEIISMDTAERIPQSIAQLALGNVYSYDDVLRKYKAACEERDLYFGLLEAARDHKTIKNFLEVLGNTESLKTSE